MQTYILTIRERNHSWAGREPLVSTHDTREEAEQELLAYVRRNWDAEIVTEPPEDGEDVIREYFDAALEAYDITSA